ncbi:hypothetical protein D3C85_894840 [compost metagenome]
MHAACDHLLAHPGLAEQQHRDLAARGLVDGLADALVGRRLADAVVLAVVGLQAAAQGGDLRLQLVEFLDHRVVLEVGLELGGVLPLLGGLADHPALVVATAAAADLLEDDLAAHERRGIAAGVAEQGPADRLVHQAQLGLADLHLEGVQPVDLGVEAALLDVDVHLDRPRAQHALEHVQLRAGEEDIQLAGVGAQLARQLGVLEAGLIAQAQEEALGALDAEQVDHLAAEVGQRRQRHQQHALLAQPDLAFLADEADLVAQVLDVRVLQLRLVLDRHRAGPLLVVVGGGGARARPISAWNRVAGKKSIKWSKTTEIDHLLQFAAAAPCPAWAGPLAWERGREVDQIVNFLAWPSSPAAGPLIVTTSPYVDIR